MPSILFNPYSIGRPKAVFDGDLLKHFGHGTAIPLWEDLTVNANHLIQATGIGQPLAQLLDGRWCAKFDGSNDSMEAVSSWGGDSEFTGIMVHKSTTPGDYIVISDGSLNVNTQMRMGQFGDDLSAFDGTNNPSGGVLDVIQTSWRVIAWSRSTTPLGNLALFYGNGKPYHSGTINGSLAWKRLGASTGGGLNFYNGVIAYYVHYGFQLTDAQIAYAMQGLARRYSLSYFTP